MKWFLFIILIIGSSYLYAQTADTLKPKYPISKLALRWSPIHLLDFYSTFQLSVEHRVSNNFSLQYEGGPVVRTITSNSNYDSKRGYKVKVMLKRYINPRYTYWAFYYGPEVYYNHVNYRKSELYFAGDHGSNGYYQFIHTQMQYREYGMNIKTGAVFRRARFTMDFQVGLNGRIVGYTAINPPPLERYTMIDNEKPIFAIKPRERDLKELTVTAGVRLGLIIR